MTNHKTAIAVAKAFALMLVASSAHAQVTNLVINGGFEQTDLGLGKGGFSKSSGMGSHALGWVSNGYNFLEAPQQLAMPLWDTSVSPAGGMYVASDGDFGNGPITQTINGLHVGDKYKLDFYYAGAQQAGFDGGTTAQWKASLGSQTFQTATLFQGGRSFTGWKQASFTYTATATSEVLKFLSVGTPEGTPPFVLLDGVSLTDISAPVPEPEEWAMMLVGAGLVSFQVRRKQAAKLTA